MITLGLLDDWAVALPPSPACPAVSASSSAAAATAAVRPHRRPRSLCLDPRPIPFANAPRGAGLRHRPVTALTVSADALRCRLSATAWGIFRLLFSKEPQLAERKITDLP